VSWKNRQQRWVEAFVPQAIPHKFCDVGAIWETHLGALSQGLRFGVAGDTGHLAIRYLVQVVRPQDPSCTHAIPPTFGVSGRARCIALWRNKVYTQ